MAIEHEGPVDRLTDEFPDQVDDRRVSISFNTGVQTGFYLAALRPESLDISPGCCGSRSTTADRARSHRGAIKVAISYDETRPGLAFLTLHFQDVATNVLTIDERTRVGHGGFRASPSASEAGVAAQAAGR